jgi:hypothetical protein
VDLIVRGGSNGGDKQGGSIGFSAVDTFGPMATIKGKLNGTAGTIERGQLAFLTRSSVNGDVLTERMVIGETGLVGIGTTNPSFTLDVSGSSRTYVQSVVNQSATCNAGVRLVAAGNNSFLEWGSDTNASGTGTSHLYIGGINGGAANAMTILSNRNVGIGTTNPALTLDVIGSSRFGNSNSSYGNIQGFVNIDGGALATGLGSGIDHMAIRSTNGNTDQIRFYSTRDSNGGSSWVSAPFLIQRYVDGTGSPFGFVKFGGTSNSQGVSLGWGTTDVLNVTSASRVGIRTSAPGFPLHVTSSIDCNSTYRFFDSNTTGLGLVTTTLGFGIFCDTRILSTNGFFANSDSRIKKALLDISDGEALQQLRRIEPTSYEYIDHIEKGSNRVYGFIAQQIKEVLPHAVSFSDQSVPDIYDLADVSGMNIYLRNKTFDFTDVSANVELISRNSGKLDVSANFYPPNTITLHTPFQQDMSEVFVYGRKVNDFHVLDKNAIFTVNVAATQELDRQLQDARAEIITLKDALSNVIQRISVLEQQNQ